MSRYSTSVVSWKEQNLPTVTYGMYSTYRTVPYHPTLHPLLHSKLNPVLITSTRIIRHCSIQLLTSIVCLHYIPMLSQASRRLKGRTFNNLIRPFSSHWKQYEMGPPDPIVGLNEAFALDTSPHKVNVGVGAYRDDEGLPYVLPCVREAERINMEQNLNHEYLGMVGDTEFVKLALEFVYGKDSSVLKEGRVAAVQTLSGTGKLKSNILQTFKIHVVHTRTGRLLYVYWTSNTNHPTQYTLSYIFIHT
jgi:hypothetical protein